jgi:hypothetical protein
LWCNGLIHYSSKLSRALSVVGFVLLILLPGCGYRFSVEGAGPTIGGGGDRTPTGPQVFLAIQNFVNQTFQPNLEYKYTTYIRQEFTASSGARVVVEETKADYLLKGAIESVTIPSLAFTPDGTRESRVIVVVRATVEDRKSGKIVWEKSATGIGEYFVGSSSDTGTEGNTSSDSLQFNQVLQDRALEQAGKGIAYKLADYFWAARDEGVFSRSEEADRNATSSGNSLVQDSHGTLKNPVTP